MSILNQASNHQRPVTYIIGAGASAEALPVVNCISDAIDLVIGHLTEAYNRHTREGNLVAPEILRQTIFTLRELKEVCETYKTVDEYAKILFIRRDDDKGRQFKNDVILFFELYAYYTKKSDRRYSHFLAKLLTRGSLEIPNHINIISWNYDYEFEKAYSKFLDLKENFEEVYHSLKAMHKGRVKEDDRPKLLKINGTLGYKNGDKLNLGVGNFFYKSKSERELNNAEVTPLIHKHQTFANNTTWEPLLSFAWEDHDNKIVQHSVNAVKSSQTLVIIGYSLPDFNRAIDKQLFSIQNVMSVRRIFVQDKYPERIISRLKEFHDGWNHLGINFIPVENTEEFCIPHDY